MRVRKSLYITIITLLMTLSGPLQAVTASQLSEKDNNQPTTTMQLPNEGRSDLQELIQRVDANVGDDSAEEPSSETEADEHEEVEPPIEDSNLPEPEEQGNQKSVVQAKAPRAITTNTNGTSTWTFDSTTGLLSFGTGQLAERIDNNLTNAGVTPANVKTIRFNGAVDAPTAVDYLFANLTQLSGFTSLNNFSTRYATSMSMWFDGTSSLSTLDLSTFVTSNVTTMFAMFYGSGVTSLDLSNWDVTKVTTFGSMFQNAKSLTTLNLTDWGVGRTASNLNMGFMFRYTTALTSLTLTNFKTTNVTNMQSMFVSSGVVGLDLSNWDVTEVTTFERMFQNATALTTLNLTDWGVNRVASSVNMSFMFFGTSSLTNPTLTNFKTTNVTNMESMFYNAGVTSLAIQSWDVSQVTTFEDMFYNANKLTTLDLSGWHTSGATVTAMFYNTTNLWKITLGEDIIFSGNPRFQTAPAIGTTIPGTSYKTTAASWQIVGTGTEFNPKGAMVTTTEMYADRTEPVTYVWANQSVQPTPAIDTISSLTFGTLGASDFFNGNSPLATNMATGSVALEDLDNTTTYNVTVAQTSDWTTDGESATIAKSDLKIKYGTSDLSTGACRFWSGTSATATKSIAFNHDDTKNFSIWLNPSTVLDTALLGKQLESELTWTLSETP
jgi:surface protein